MQVIFFMSHVGTWVTATLFAYLHGRCFSLSARASLLFKVHFIYLPRIKYLHVFRRIGACSEYYLALGNGTDKNFGSNEGFSCTGMD